MLTTHTSSIPSALLAQVTPLLKPSAHVLDLACGSGRNGLWLQQQGFEVTYLDKDQQALASIAQNNGKPTIIAADLESSVPYRLTAAGYDAIIVFRYLHRPLMSELVKALKPGGILVYETFTSEQATIGRPKNPDFLLQDNELPTTFSMLSTHFYEQGFNQVQQTFIAQYIGIKD